MTDAPIAQRIHEGHGLPPAWRRKLIAEWLAAHDINPEHVSANEPITVLTVPDRPPVDGEGPWPIQVIAFHQMYVRPDGAREVNFLTCKPVTFQRTVPLRVPFPASPTTDEKVDGP